VGCGSFLNGNILAISIGIPREQLRTAEVFMRYYKYLDGAPFSLWKVEILAPRRPREYGSHLKGNVLAFFVGTST
jgi:hypothetical protein